MKGVLLGSKDQKNFLGRKWWQVSQVLHLLFLEKESDQLSMRYWRLSPKASSSPHLVSVTSTINWSRRFEVEMATPNLDISADSPPLEMSWQISQVLSRILVLSFFQRHIGEIGPDPKTTNKIWSKLFIARLRSVLDSSSEAGRGSKDWQELCLLTLGVRKKKKLDGSRTKKVRKPCTERDWLISGRDQLEVLRVRAFLWPSAIWRQYRENPVKMSRISSNEESSWIGFCMEKIHLLCLLHLDILFFSFSQFSCLVTNLYLVL